MFELLSLSDPASVKERTTSMCPCLARFHTLLGSAAWAVALKSGRRPQAQPVSLPEAFGGNRRL